MNEYVGRPREGRTFGSICRVRLSDADSDGRLRVDGLARFLQDVATDDWNDSGIVTDDVWVVRRTAWRWLAGRPWPALDQEVALATWCGGTGAAWAERRTDLSIDGAVAIEVASLWVPVGPEGRPRRVGREFLEVYGPAAAGRRVSGRVAAPVVDRAAPGRPWALRRSDIDVVGHVNNAAVWFAVAEVMTPGARSVTVTHHGAVEAGDEVTLHALGGRLWLVVGGEARVSGEFEVD